MIKIYIKNIIIEIFVIFALVAGLFQIPSLQYVDELCEVLSIMYIIYYILINKKIANNIEKILIFSFALLIIGLFGNIFFSLQYNYIYVAQDIFSFFKPILIFIAVYLYINENTIISLKKNLINISKISIIALFITLLISLIIRSKVTLCYSSWVPIPSLPFFVFFTKYPALLAAYISVLLVMILSDYKKNDILYVAMSTVLLVSTQSGTAAMIVILELFIFFLLGKKKIKVYQIIFIVLIGIYFGMNEITTYLTNSTSARGLMYSNSIKLALKYFPFGTGFSTYGSVVAGKYYSKVYYILGYKSVWGLNGLTNDNFLYDTFYPIIFGQFGIVGTVIYIFYNIYLYLCFNKCIINRKSLLFGLFSTLIINFGQGAILSTFGMLMFIVLAVLFKDANLQKGWCNNELS